MRARQWRLNGRTYNKSEQLSDIEMEVFLHQWLEVINMLSTRPGQTWDRKISIHFSRQNVGKITIIVNYGDEAQPCGISQSDKSIIFCLTMIVP